ncbi:hypothetical protein [Vreelandella titanicae]|uniref:Uncharacterized protein n=1 Tax=Vreelandella titanicae TaxID=664683 RepID=A0A558J725_9GAMM|nr:hypothetical protein [Halomonas titanicae]TVU89403.1 hypothetical protein FQP89_15550 [Halomonas titanicae]
MKEEKDHKDQGSLSESQQEQLDVLIETMRRNLEEANVDPEVQQEALRTLSEVAKSAAYVSKEHFEAITRSAEARAKFFTEALSKSESKEEREAIYKLMSEADIRDSEERKSAAEKAADVLKFTAKCAGIAIVGIGGLTIAAIGWAKTKG